MKWEVWNEGLNNIDPELVEAYILQKDALRQRKRSRRVWMRSIAIAASFCLVIGAIFAVPMFIKYDDVADLNKEKLVLMHFDTMELYNKAMKDGFEAASMKGSDNNG